MNISERQIVSITEANQNFSAVARKVDERKKVVVFKNNQPKYVVYSIEEAPMELTDSETDSEKIDVAAKRVLARYHKAFEELAK